MKNSNKNNIRNAYLSKIVGLLKDAGEDIGYIASNKINMPVVDEEGNEEWVTVTVSVPLGEGRGKEPYDGYGERESFEMKEKEKAEKAAEKAKKKAQNAKPAKSSKSEEEE